MPLLHEKILDAKYDYGCEVEPEVIIHPQRINDQTYYIAETTEDVDFEFKGKKLVKMWDVKEERTYYPDAVMKMVKDKDSLLHDLYKRVTNVLDLYINKPSEYMHVSTNTHRRNVYALNNIRKAENSLSKKAVTIRRGCESEPPYIYERPTWPEYIAVVKDRYVHEAYTVNNARMEGIRRIDREYTSDREAMYVKIYKKSSKAFHYQYIGTVLYGAIGKYRMMYFINKNGAFQMNSDGSLAGALYRW